MALELLTFHSLLNLQGGPFYMWRNFKGNFPDLWSKIPQIHQNIIKVEIYSHLNSLHFSTKQRNIQAHSINSQLQPLVSVLRYFSSSQRILCFPDYGRKSSLSDIEPRSHMQLAQTLLLINCLSHFMVFI